MTDYLLKNLFVMQYSPSEKGKKVNGRRLSTFMYVEEGMYHYSSDYVDFYVEAGDAVYVPEGGVYEYAVVSEYARVIQAEFSFEKRGDQCLKTFFAQPTLMKRSENNLAPIFHEMLNNYYKNEYLTAASVYSLIGIFSERSVLPGAGKIEHALRYIEENFKSKIYVSQLAEMCGLSEPHMRRLFAELVGMSPIKYKNSLIIKAACNMLLGERLNVSETAEALGFGDIYTFSQLFKKEVGISPKKYADTVIK